MSGQGQQHLPARVAERAKGAMAHGYIRTSSTPSLARQRDTMADLKKRIAERAAAVKNLSSEQIKLKAEQTMIRDGPLRETNLRTKAVKTEVTMVKEEMGHKQVVKTEYRGSTSGGLNQNWGSAQSMIQQRKAELMARIKAQQIATGLKNGSIQEKKLDDDLSVMEQKQKPKGFDKLGRPLDQYGNVIELSMPSTDTLINQRRKNKDKFKRKFEDVSSEKVETQEQALEKVAKIEDKKTEEGTLAADILRGDAIPETSQFFDPRFKEKKPSRQNRSFFDWHEEGTFVKKGKVMRQQAQLKDLQMQIEQAAKRTGVQQASKLAAVAHSAVKDTMALTVNELDWWDKKIIMEPQQNIEEDFDPEEYRLLGKMNEMA